MSHLLPPGSQFYPSDEVLVRYYLRRKNEDKACDLIKDLNLYDYEPFDLPENACYWYGNKGCKRHWYCYTKKVRVLKNGDESKRRRKKAKGGYWRRSGQVKDIVDLGRKVVIGTRSRFVFYSGSSVQNLTRTDWVLYEYALIHHVEASYVLCRVFVKSRGGNSVSENVLSCCAEESVSAVRHVGVQHDCFVTPDIVEAKVHHGRSVASNKTKLYDRLSRGHISVPNCRSPSAIQFKLDSSEPVGSPGLPGADLLVGAETNQQSVSILEGDFIEIDDLVD